MAKFRIVPESENVFQLQFMCPGCKELHALNSTWNFDGDLQNPSVHPSVLIRGWLNKDIPSGICHSFIERGKIQFLDDCSHSLKGQTVELPEIK